MGVVHHGLYRRPWPSCAHSGATCLFPASWVTPGALGLLWFKWGGALPNFYLGSFKGFIRHIMGGRHGLVGECRFWDKMYWYILSSKCTGTLLIFSAREKFSSGTETMVGNLLSLAVYFSWQYILVGSICWIYCWIVVSGKSKFVDISVLSVISWLLLCVQIHLPPLNTTVSSCLQIQALKQYQLSDTTCESPYSRL